MFAAGQDDVSNIHRRWSFTTLGPSSSKQSFAISLISATVIAVISHLVHLGTSIDALELHLPLGLAVLAGAHMLDYFALRGTPVNKLSKVAHVAAFANALWALTVLLGVAANVVFAKQGGGDYIIAGMLLAVGLRIGIFTSVFGASTRRAIGVSFIQPLVFLFAFLTPASYGIILSPAGLVFGFALVTLGIVWTIIADRAGRPGIKSTFGLLQAFISAWTEHKVDKIEEFTEAKAHDDIVSTKIVRFIAGGKQAAIVLPDVHPGPFSTVGGSNLPYVLYEAFSKSALVMHSVSDHSLNIPSKRQVDKYVGELGRASFVEKGSTCSVPVKIRTNNATATGIAFGNTAIVMLSLAPAGMEDVPQGIRTELESYGMLLGFSDVLVVDCHNAMGKHLNDSDKADLASSAKQCLEQLKRQPQNEFTIGFASLEDSSQKLDPVGELGQAGLAVLVIGTVGQNYAIGWADSNNMENKLRDDIISKISDGVSMLEVCTSDTHSTSGKRTRVGYFALGTTSNHDDIAAAYLQMCQRAIERASKSTFEFAFSQSTIKVMGNKQFEDYSSALDKSMTITKTFLAITVATYIAMLVMS
jgi:putative membrane protein